MKIAMIYHSVDLDGWMSAAIVKHWFNTTKVGQLGTFKDDPSIIIKPFDTLTFIGYNYGQPIPDLSEYDKVIMCDISFSKEDMYRLSLRNNLIWIDHHISAINDIESNKQVENELIEGLRDINFAACELTWQFLFPNEPMPEIVRLLGRYDCFGHKGTDEEREVLEFQYACRSIISNYNDAYYYLQSYLQDDTSVTEALPMDGAAIYSYLKTEAKHIYAKRFDIFFHTPNSKNTNLHQRFACINHTRFNPVNFGIDYHAHDYDGVACWWYEEGKICFSLYNDNGLVDCSQIAKQYGGGGHKGASGFIIKCNDHFMPMTITRLINTLGSGLKAQNI